MGGLADLTPEQQQALKRLHDQGIDLRGLRPNADYTTTKPRRSLQGYLPTRTTNNSGAMEVTQSVGWTPQTRKIAEANRAAAFEQWNAANPDNQLSIQTGPVQQQRVGELGAGGAGVRVRNNPVKGQGFQRGPAEQGGSIGGQLRTQPVGNPTLFDSQSPAVQNAQRANLANMTPETREFMGIMGAYGEKFKAANPDANPAQVKRGAMDLFYNDAAAKLYSGELTAKQRESLLSQTENPNLRNTQRNELKAIVSQNALTPDLSKQEFRQAREQWISDVRRMERNNPEEFQRYITSSPEWATRYFASMATGRYGSDRSKKEYQALADQAAYMQGQAAGYGKDGKQDGKAFASGYGGAWGDINNENGPGDFWKLGTPSKMKGGFKDFIEDNPWQAAGIVATAVIAPQLTGALVAQGMNPILAGALVGGGSSAITGGDVTQGAILGGATGLFTGLSNGSITLPGGGGDAMKLTATAADGADKVITAGGILKDGGKGLINVLAKGAGYDYKNPIPKNSSGVFGTVDKDGNTGPKIGDTQVKDGKDWSWRYDVLNEQWRPVANDKLEEVDGGGGGGNDGNPANDPFPTDPGGASSSTPVGGDAPVQGEEGDRWVWTGSVLQNTVTGATREVPNGDWMETGAVYNGDAEKIEEGDTDSETGGATTDALVDLIKNIPGLLDGVTGDGTGGGTTGGGRDTGGDGDLVVGGGYTIGDTTTSTSNDSGSGDGTGGGDGTGDGDGSGDGEGPGIGGDSMEIGLATAIAGKQRRDLFDYTKISPAMTAVLGPFLNQITGEYNG